MTNPTEKFEKLLEVVGKTNPKLRKKLEEKYDQDRIEFIDFINEKGKDLKWEYWAKQSCKHCYGKGKYGVRDGKDLLCACAHRGYNKWVRFQRVQFLEAKKDDYSKD